MTNQSLMIANYINHAFIESQLERADSYNSQLCVVKFELKFDPKEGDRFKEIVSFMYSFLGYTPIVYEGGEHFLIFIHESKLHNVVMTIKNMTMSVKIKYGLNVHNIGITAYDQSDDKNELIGRVHKFFMKSKINKEIDIYYGTKFFEYSHTGNFENIRSIITQEPMLNLYGFYKEAPLMSKVEIIDFNSGIMNVKAHKEYLLFFKKQEFIYIEHVMIPDIMRAEITKINFDNGEIELDNLKFLDNSPVHRKNVRVTPHRPIQATVEFESEFYMDGLIADISKNSILLTTQLSKIEEIQAKGLQTKSFELKFHLDSQDNSASINVRAMIYKTFGNQIVLNIYPSSEMENEIIDYIAMCQNLLLLEVKGTFVH
ncbi:MAG: hypothetical protein K0U47_04955 [Epsilonproteobacteria bacterium]|nr:hypothetical protein [Campylobacterota bacterium]